MEKEPELMYNRPIKGREDIVMLFRKNMEPRCGYCTRSSPAEPGTVICTKKGICTETDHCRSFRYDPLKRVPPQHRMMDFSKYDDTDYSL